MKNNNQGFTLLEVMIAVIIFMLVAVAATDVASQSADGILRMTDKTLAQMVAENRYNKIKIAGGLPAKGITRDTVELADREWHITTEVEDHDFKMPIPDTRKIEIRVAYANDKENPVFSYIGYMGKY